MFEKKLVTLKSELASFAALVEQMIEKSMTGILQKDRALLEAVIDTDEPRANDYELELDELCTSLLAQYNPRSRNLRTIVMILKINNDLERLGDLAVNVCESGLNLLNFTLPRSVARMISSIEHEALAMLRNSVAAFIGEDSRLARDVCKNDEAVDSLRDRILLESMSRMKSEPAAVDEYIHIIRISRNLERVADLSTNISEDVLYMVEGEIIKHHRNREAPEQ